MSAEGDAGRIVVTHGGTPTDEEVAALVLALSPVAPEPAEAARAPAWVHAAILEAAGHAPVSRPSDLDAPGAPL